jgi:hypothetical protein
MRARVFLGFLTALAPFLAAGGAGAQPAQPLDRLLPQIRREHPGQFLDAEGATIGGNPHYHLKWLTPDGRVIWLDADARSGRVVNTSPGRDNFDAGRARAPESGAPPDRRSEGRSSNPRYYDRSDESRFGNRQNYRSQPEGGEVRPDFGGRFGGQGGGYGRPGFGDRGGPGGERGYGGGRDRGGERR